MNASDSPDGSQTPAADEAARTPAGADEPHGEGAPIPATIGPYQIVRKLGDGGMAETFEAVRRRPGGFEKRVCIKRVLYPFSGDPIFREEFVQEARLLAQLDHHGIVQAYDYDEDQGLCYLVMQLIDGVDYAKILDHFARNGRRLPPGVAAHVAAEVADALDYLHTFVDADGVPRNIVHRDISPQNILISRRGDVKLADFGIAKFEGRPKLTKTTQTKGKLWYMSPEHIEPRRGLDARSDLFSLGAVLYESLSGTSPFQRATQAGSHHAILDGIFAPLLDTAPYLDPELCQLIEQLLAPSKDDRPGSARELAAVLRHAAPHSAPRRALAAAVRECLNDADEPPQELALASTTAWLERLGSLARPRRAERSSSVPSLDPPIGAASRAETRRAVRFNHTPRRRGWLAAAAALVLVSGAAWLLPLGFSAPRQPQVPVPADDAASSKAELATTQDSSERAQSPSLPASEPEQPPSSDSAQAAGTASVAHASEEEQRDPGGRGSRSAARDGREQGALKVVVLNWGYVWVDGVFKGKAPVYVDLAPGLHSVSVSQVPDKPGKPERVRVAPGKLVKHEVRLNAPLFQR